MYKHAILACIYDKGIKVRMAVKSFIRYHGITNVNVEGGWVNVWHSDDMLQCGDVL